MHDRAFDHLTKSIGAGVSRRGLLRALGGGGLSLGLLGRTAVPDAVAKNCKKIKDKKKRKACRKKATDATAQVPGAPASQTVAVTCPGPAELNFFDSLRSAQTFTAPISGQLTSAQIEIASRVDNDFTVEIRPLDGGGVPTASVLASARIENVAVGLQTLTATFAAPPSVQAGIGYALVVTADPGQIYAVLLRTGDDCPGQFFADSAVKNTFVPVNALDMIFSVTIVG